MVRQAVKQNAAQLMARNRPYALEWIHNEALRLVAWLAVKSGVSLDIELKRLNEMSRTQLVEKLTPLWGRKLGSERSREARSSRYVLTALSDFNGQIQARDIVRFVNEAAKRSLEDGWWKDRILTPRSIKEAVSACGKEKITEINEENPLR